MKIDYLTPEHEILKELGRRLARTRKQQRMSQTLLAQEAGLGVATLRRIEAGQDSQMESWLKLLKALQLASAVDAILPENVNSPMAEVRAKPRKKHKAAVQAVAQGPPWGDEQT